jgi:hypothetical protein
MEKKTIEQLVEMSGEELKAYLGSFTVIERTEINDELHKAKIAADVQKLLDNLHRNPRYTVRVELS